MTDSELAALVEPGRVHRRCYTDPAIFDEEMRRLFGGVWTFVGHESQIREPGDFVRVRLGTRPVLMCRDDEGRVQVLLNRCMHRGVTVCAEECGNTKRFVCPYHGWTYSLDGRLVGVPFPADYPPGFDRSERGLRTVPSVASRHGFVFASMRPDAIPLDEWLGEAGRWIDWYAERAPGGGMSLSRVPLRLRVNGNWKLVWDNASDGLHPTFAHASYNRLGERRDRRTVLARDPGHTPMTSTALSNGHQVVDQRPDLHDGSWASQRPVPFSDDLTEQLRDRVGDEADAWLELAAGAMVNLSVFPNLIFVGNQIMVVEPLGVTETRLTLWLMVSAGQPDEINALRFRVEEDFTNFGTPDDLVMFERAQQGLAIEEIEWVDISRGIHLDDERRDGDGHVVGPITSEAPARGFWSAWAQALAGPD